MRLIASARDFASDVNLPESRPMFREGQPRNYGRQLKVVYCRTAATMVESIRQRDPFQSHWNFAVGRIHC